MEDAPKLDPLETYTPQASVIGAILLEPKRMGEAVLILSEDDFLDTKCRVVWQMMVRIFRQGKSVDLILLRDALEGFPNAAAFLADCMEAAPCAGNFLPHVQALKRQAMLHRLRDIGKELSECATLEDAAELLEKGNAIRIQNAARERRTMAQMYKSFAQRHASQVTPDYLKWPFKQLDDGIKLTGGKFAVIGGYPSDGKTAFALQAAFVQSSKNRNVGFYSFETDANTVEDRMLANLAGIGLDVIQDNRLSDDDWSRYAMQSDSTTVAFDAIAAAGMTVDDIRADALANRYSVIYIDYLQLISPSRRNSNFSRFDEVSEISRDLQRLAKTTGITVVALSQMTRPAADKKGSAPRPTMHNLRESGQIEQDADVIMLIYREDQKDIRAPRFLDVAKNKEGRTGQFTLTFDGAHQRFSLPTGEAQKMRMNKKVLRPTPVIGGQEENMQFSLLTGPDDNLPF